MSDHEKRPHQNAEALAIAAGISSLPAHQSRSLAAAALWAREDCVSDLTRNQLREVLSSSETGFGALGLSQLESALEKLAKKKWIWVDGDQIRVNAYRLLESLPAEAAGVLGLRGEQRPSWQPAQLVPLTEPKSISGPATVVIYDSHAIEDFGIRMAACSAVIPAGPGVTFRRLTCSNWLFAHEISLGEFKVMASPKTVARVAGLHVTEVTPWKLNTSDYKYCGHVGHRLFGGPSSWEVGEKHFELTIKIPAGSSTVLYPSGRTSIRVT